ncbi:two-component system response regulator [Chitinimonas sp. BJB300]|uniref:two-component system response regulator n=1 Tax=Chitinimonas sp. BJB300 TaxID=1559339 RepID=UPI000C0DE4E7|nr:EAL domain-containing protein [Chitinimonas sp. BJB300]PHV11389.1 diguanylate phosphodiesterase [Chitinimonas sp. BJB300]TSJ88893.1 EAL domain-containing protein [Chitinimonas sp. BJB300]
MRAERILIVEDEPVVALDLRQTLEGIGHEVCGIHSNVISAVHAVELHHPSLVLMDIHLQGPGDGIDACQMIYEKWKVPVIFLTAYVDEKTVSRAACAKPFGYLSKPYKVMELNAAIQVARSRHDVEIALCKAEEKLAIAIEAAELGTWEWTSLQDEIEGDERFWRIWGSGLQSAEMPLSAMLDQIHPEDLPEVKTVLEAPGFFKSEFRVLRDNGEHAWFEMYGNLGLKPPDQQILIGALRDVTLRKEMEERLQQASVVFRATAEGILILDADGIVISINPAFTRLTGFVESDAVGQHPAVFLLNRRDQDLSYNDIAKIPSGFWSGEVAFKCKDGRILPVLQHICVVRDNRGTVVQYVQTLSDISAIREAERQLAHLAYHDPLTGLGNRYLLDQRLETELERAKQHHGNVAILFIDLDGFKSINDSMGHHVGDRVIKEIAIRITSAMRRNDEAIRLGGDEFVVIAPDLRQSIETIGIANKILSTVLEPFNMEGQQLVVGASIGMARYPEDGETPAQLLSAADSAMYEAKRLGKGQICAYSSNLVENVRTRINIEQSLHGALERGEFVVYYQPIVDLYGLKLIGFEALLRWQHPILGLLEPEKFINITEENGSIAPIGAWVLKSAVNQIVEWNHRYDTQLFISINISSVQFRRSEFLTELKALLMKSGISPHLLEIEVTESMLQDFHASSKIVQAMRDLHVCVAIDDFGTGFSSLALLKYLSVTRIKIDRSFIVSLPGTGRDVGLVSGIMQMANSLELEVTAEGLETPEQVGLLRAMGCPAVQGFFFGKPWSIEEYTEGWISSKIKKGGFATKEPSK